MTKLSPSAQAIFDAYGKTVVHWFAKKENRISSQNYHTLAMAATIRAVADFIFSGEFQWKSGETRIPHIIRNELLTIAKEMEEAAS